MATKEQTKANRTNAKKSTGPKTTEGKEKSSQNAVKHGFFTQQDVIKHENQVDYDMLRHEILEELNPIGPMQYRLADRIVSLSWRLKRVERMNNQTIDIMLEKDALKYRTKTDKKYADPYKFDPDLALGRIAKKDFSEEKLLDRLIMYERRIENSLYKTIKELKKLKNEPNFTPSVEAKRGSAAGGPINSSTHSPIHSSTHSPINSSTHSPIHPNIQNKPNFTPHAAKNPINHSRPQSQTRYGGAESTNIEDPPMEESIITNQ